MASKTATKKTATEPSLDESLAELEKLVETLEDGDLTLDEAMRQFEHGIELTRRCQAALAAAEQKVEILMQKAGGDAEIEPFDDD
ncbi:MAG: exodeoxyribonuclease VII small subunit [Pseudomonadota bacterium]